MDRPVHLLVVDDSSDDAELMARVLRRNGYRPDLQRVDTIEGLSRALRDVAPWDIVACDEALPRLTIERTVGLINALAPRVPILLLSGRCGADASEVVKNGRVNAFLSKDRLEDFPAMVSALLPRRPRAKV
jgi:hypothetical protein